MSTLITTAKGETGWVVEMSKEMAGAVGVPEGSLVVLYLNNATVSAEILPPPSEDIKRSVQQSIDKFQDAFTEMKRLGD